MAKNRLYFIQKIDKKSHKCCSTLTAKCSECFSASISLYSKDFDLNASQSASNFFCHFSRYRSKNHEDIFSQIAKFTPKSSLEGCLPFWLLFNMAEKSACEVLFHGFECLLLRSARNLEPRVSPALCQRLVAWINSGTMDFNFQFDWLFA